MIKNRSGDEYTAWIAENIREVREKAAMAAEADGRTLDDISIMAVTKTVDPAHVNAAAKQGIKLLGENRAQELIQKYDAYILDFQNIHFIGHLQSNKIKYIIDKVSMIQSLDSEKLAKEIDRQAGRIRRTMDVLVEINIGGEESKSGIAPDKLDAFMESIAGLQNICIRGLMAIPPMERPEKYFAKMQRLFLDRNGKKMDNMNMTVLSMGMSADYETAIRFGANMIRLGTAIFGRRK